MVNSRTIAAIGLALLVAGCSMSDHPIPPLDVGSGGSVLGMNASDGGSDYASVDVVPQREAAYPREDLSVSRVRMPPAPVGGSSGSFGSGNNARDVAYADDSDRSYDERNRGGARTLDAQAAEIDPPAAPARAPVTRARDRDPEPVEQEPQVAAVQFGPARIALAEVSGVGVEAAQPLAVRFGAQAKAHGLAFTAATDTTATHIMKGYFTVGEDGGRTVVNYVWDISDRSGKRLHRIQGSEPAGGSGSGWEAVKPAAMQAIADRSITETARFIGAENG
jgi:hypothetical protein